VNEQIMILVGRIAHGDAAGKWTAFTMPHNADVDTGATTVDAAVAACTSATFGLLLDEVSLRAMLMAYAQPMRAPYGMYYLMPTTFDPRLPLMYQSVRRVVQTLGVAAVAAASSPPPCLRFEALAWVPLFAETYNVLFFAPFWADLHRIRRVMGAPMLPPAPAPMPMPMALTGSGSGSGSTLQRPPPPPPPPPPPAY
jgi:hypothetical protein